MLTKKKEPCALLFPPSLKEYSWIDIFLKVLALSDGGARGVMVIVVGNGLGDTSSNPGGD